MVDTGRRPAVNPDDVLEVFEETDAPFLSTSEVADAVDVSKPTAIDRLRTLQEEGAIRSREVAGNTPVWYLPELENRRLVQDTDDDEYRTLARAPPEEEPEPTTDGDAVSGGSAERELFAAVEEHVQAVIEKETREAVRAAFEEYEKERAREESEETVDTWGEKCHREARNAWDILTRASIPLPIMLVVYGFLPESVKSISVPVLGTVTGILLIAGALLTFLAVYAVLHGVIAYAGWRTGAADRLEQTFVGDFVRFLHRVIVGGTEKERETHTDTSTMT